MFPVYFQFHARQCPDCIKIRRAQNTYFGLSPDTPMQVRKYASMVSLKSLEVNGAGTRPTSQMSQYSQYSSTYELNRCATPTNQQQQPLQQLNGYSTISNNNSLQRQGSSTHIIPIEREGASSSLSRASSRNDNNLYHIHDHNGQMCRSQSQMSMISTNSGVQGDRAARLGGKNVGWKKSQDNLQYIAKNQSPYLYNEPGKFPLHLNGEEYGNGNKQIRFEEVMTKKEYEAVQKHY